MNWHTLPLNKLEQAQWKHFCKQHKQSLPQRNDWALFASQAQRPIGLVRLIPSSENPRIFLLRGLFIAPDCRHQGYARSLMQQIEQRLDYQAIAMFALPHLEDFYQSLGYQPCESTHLPQSIKTQWLKAINEGKDWVLMYKTKSH